MEAMYVKAVHDGTIRRLSVSPTDCEGLRAAVAAAFDLPTPSEVAFTWEDDEGDAVALATNADVDEARRVGGGLLRLTLTPVGAPTPTTDRAAPKAAAALTARQMARAAAVAAAQQQARGARVAKKADAKAARAVRAAAAKEVKAAAGREAKAARQAAAAAAKAERLAAHAEGKAANRRAAVAARQAAKAAAAATDGEATEEGSADGAAGGGRRGGRGGGRDGQVPNWGAAYFSPGGLGQFADAAAAGGAPPTAAPLCGGGMDAAAAALYSIPAVATALATAGRGRGFWHAECARRGVGPATDAAAAVAMRAVAAAGGGPVSRAVVAALDGVAGRAFVASAAAGGEAGAAAGGPRPGSPALDADAVDGAAGALEGALLDEGVSADDAAAIMAGVRAVLSERLVVKAIRYMAAATTADGAADEAVAVAVATALATHPPRTCCGRCGVSPIVGTRYRPAADADATDDADLCGRCYDAAAPAAGRYEALPHPWLAAPAYARLAADGDAAAMPPAPLRFYARGPRVAHLQAVLIAGGHLSPRQVAGAVGWYGPATRGAVAGVQQAAGVAGRVREVGMYDARTRAVLLEAVKNPSGAPVAVPARDAMDVAQVPSQA